MAIGNEPFVQTFKVRVDDSQALQSIARIKKELASLRDTRLRANGNGGVSGGNSGSGGGSGGYLIHEQRKLAKSTSHLNLAFEKLSRSVDKVNVTYGNNGGAGIIANGGYKSPLPFGRLGGLAAVMPGMMQMASMVIAPMKAMFSTGFGALQSFESLKTDLGTLLGNDREGAAFAERIRKYASATPYSQRDLSGTAKMLLQYGASTDEAETYLKQLGDIALGNSQQMQSLGLVLGQVRSAGKLQGQDLMQFINAGFNPLSIMSQQTGKSMAELREEMSKGKISFEMVAEALKATTSEGGKFYKGAERGAMTIQGLISTIKDNFETALAEGIEQNIGGIKDTLTKLKNVDMKPVVKGMADFSKGILELANMVVNNMDSILGVGRAIGWIVKTIAEFPIPTAAFIAGKFIPSLVTQVKSINTFSGQAAGGLTQLNGSLSGLVRGGLISILAAEIATLGTAAAKAVKANYDASQFEQNQKAGDHMFDIVKGARSKWKEAKAQYGSVNNPYAQKAISEAEQEYRKQAERYTTEFGRVLPADWGNELGGNFAPKDASKNAAQEASKNAKANTTIFNNTVNQTNNISTSFDEYGELLKKNIRALTESALTITASPDLARSAV